VTNKKGSSKNSLTLLSKISQLLVTLRIIIFLTTKYNIDLQKYFI